MSDEVSGMDLIARDDEPQVWQIEVKRHPRGHITEWLDGPLTDGVIEVVPAADLRGAVDLLRRGIDLASYARYTAADATAEEWIAEARALIDSGGQS